MDTTIVGIKVVTGTSAKLAETTKYKALNNKTRIKFKVDLCVVKRITSFNYDRMLNRVEHMCFLENPLLSIVTNVKVIS